jgi:dTDP-4-amino-4,6-dideoxygalactose transaminase
MTIWAVPLSHIEVDEEMISAVADVVASGWWSMGPRVEAFEEQFADFLGVKHAVAVASGTAALHLALKAAGITRGDEVILPSLTFVAAANAIAHLGARPVFCDIVSERDLNLDVRHVEQLVGPRTRAIVALHYAGFPCDLAGLKAVAARHGLVLIEDAAHAPGALWRGASCGTVGAMGCFSFFSNKNLPMGEGGLVVTGDDAIATDLRLMRSHGMTRLTWDRERGHASAYDVVLHGFNFRIDEIRAALGTVLLRRLSAMNEARRRAWTTYRDLLTPHAAGGLVVPFADADGDVRPAHHLAVVVLPQGVERALVQAQLAEQGIQTSVHYPPTHMFSAFEHFGERARLPVTEDLQSRILTLPLHPYLTDDAVAVVASALQATISQESLVASN